MPRRDKTGPLGQGAMTGRGLGVCTGSNARFFGFPRGGGCGNRRYVTDLYPPSLEQEKEALQNRLDEINKQLKE